MNPQATLSPDTITRGPYSLHSTFEDIFEIICPEDDAEKNLIIKSYHDLQLNTEELANNEFKSKAIKALKLYPELLGFANHAVRNDFDCVLTAVSKCPLAYFNASDHLRTNFLICLEAFRGLPNKILTNSPNRPLRQHFPTNILREFLTAYPATKQSLDILLSSHHIVINDDCLSLFDSLALLIKHFEDREYLLLSRELCASVYNNYETLINEKLDLMENTIEFSDSTSVDFTESSATCKFHDTKESSSNSTSESISESSEATGDMESSRDLTSEGISKYPKSSGVNKKDITFAQTLPPGTAFFSSDAPSGSEAVPPKKTQQHCCTIS